MQFPRPLAPLQDLLLGLEDFRGFVLEEELVGVFVNGLRGSPAIHSLGAFVPIDKAILQVADHNRVLRLVQQRGLFPQFGFGHFVLRPLPCLLQCVTDGANEPFGPLFQDVIVGSQFETLYGHLFPDRPRKQDEGHIRRVLPGQSQGFQAVKRRQVIIGEDHIHGVFFECPPKFRPGLNMANQFDVVVLVLQIKDPQSPLGNGSCSLAHGFPALVVGGASFTIAQNTPRFFTDSTKC